MVTYDPSDEPMVMSKTLFKLMKDQADPMLVWGVYSFYYYTAKYQKTNQVRCTVNFISKGLKCSDDKVRKARKILIELGLIEDVQSLNENGKFNPSYVKVNFIWSKSTVDALPKTGIPSTRHTVKQQTNALSSNKENASSNKNKMLVDFFENERYIPLAKKLFSTIKEKKLSPRLKYNEKQWSTQLYELHKEIKNIHKKENSYSPTALQDVINWYCNNMGLPYIKHAYSMITFVKRFDELWEQMNSQSNNQVSNSKGTPRAEDEELSNYEKEVWRKRVREESINDED